MEKVQLLYLLRYVTCTPATSREIITGDLLRLIISNSTHPETATYQAGCILVPFAFQRRLAHFHMEVLVFCYFQRKSSFYLTNWRQFSIVYLTNRFQVAVRLFSNRSQMTSKCGKNKKVAHEAQPSVSLMWHLLYKTLLIIEMTSATS